MFTTGEDSRSLTEKLIGILRKEAQALAVGRGCCSKEEGCCDTGETHEADLPVDQMEFWGTEVAPGKPQVNEPGDDTYVHVSQVALGPSKDGKSERVVIRVESGGKNVVLGTLCSGKVDQMTLDLIFDREFKLSHTSTSSSVFFCGYRTDKQQEEYDDESEEDEDEEDDDEDDEPVPTAVLIKENGTVSEGKAAKKQLKAVEKVEAKPKKADIPKPSLVDKEAEEGEESDDEDDDDEDEDSDGEEDKAIRMDFGTDDYDEEDDSSFEVDDAGILESSDEDDSDEDDEDEDDEDDEDEDDEDDLAAELGKKRSLQSSAKKTSGEGKKPRLDTPAKPGLITTPGKKGAKGAADTKSTPVSTKKEKESKGAVAKTPLKTPGKETTVKTPKTTPPGAGASAKKLGAHHCAECDRNFATDSALSQHGIAKHKK